MSMVHKKNRDEELVFFISILNLTHSLYLIYQKDSLLQERHTMHCVCSFQELHSYPQHQHAWYTLYLKILKA